jgi:hypothetical protein
MLAASIIIGTAVGIVLAVLILWGNYRRPNPYGSASPSFGAVAGSLFVGLSCVAIGLMVGWTLEHPQPSAAPPTCVEQVSV